MASDAHPSQSPEHERDRRTLERDVRAVLGTLDGSRASAISLLSALDEVRIHQLGGTAIGPGA
jgi:hypothetical protein